MLRSWYPKGPGVCVSFNGMYVSPAEISTPLGDIFRDFGYRAQSSVRPVTVNHHEPILKAIAHHDLLIATTV